MPAESVSAHLESSISQPAVRVTATDSDRRRAPTRGRHTRTASGSASAAVAGRCVTHTTRKCSSSDSLTSRLHNASAPRTDAGGSQCYLPCQWLPTTSRTRQNTLRKHYQWGAHRKMAHHVENHEPSSDICRIENGANNKSQNGNQGQMSF